MLRLYLTESRWLRLTSFTAFYFAQGVPIGLMTIAVPAWLAEQGVGLAQIAAYQGVIALPWAFKLIVGPFMDRFAFPAMGRRRPWVMAAQLGLTVSIGAIALVPDAIEQFSWLIVLGFVSNAFAAVQDVAVDGMAIDVLPMSERGRANALMAFGQVAGFSSFAALTGGLLDSFGLPAAAIVSALAVGLVMVLVTVTRERTGERLLPWTPGTAAEQAHASESTFRGIFRDLFRVLFLPMSLLLVLIEFLVRVRDGMALSISPTFAVQQLGLASVDYSQYQGYIGVPIAMIGVMFGPLIDRFGIKRLYMTAMLVSAAASFLLAYGAQWWSNLGCVVTVDIVLKLSSQMLFVAYIALAMNICSPRVAATQFAIYMSLSNLSRSVGAGVVAGFADQIDYAESFVVIGLLMTAAALALSFFSAPAHTARLRLLDAGS